MKKYERAAGFTSNGEGFQIPVITVSAQSPFERGVQYGSLAAKQIEASIDYYASLFLGNHGMQWRDVAERAGQWAKPIEDFDADLFAELRGIAEGSAHSLGEILALNARGEMVYTDLLAADGCTSFALLSQASQSRHSFAGQNWDWRTGTSASRIMLRMEQKGKPTISMLVEAGQLGRHGVNSEGIALFANGLPAKQTVIGVPQAVIRRRILDQSRFDLALDVALKAPGQIPANLIIAHREFAIDLETTPGETRWGYPDAGILTHANHYEYFTGPEYAMPSLGADSLYRGQLLRQHLGRAGGVHDSSEVLEIIADSLADTFGQPNGISVHPDPSQPKNMQWATLTSTLIDLTDGIWYMADGAPDERPYWQLPWNVYDTAV